MTRLADTGVRIRSKNAGPFWLTVDLFCETAEVFDLVRLGLSDDAVAQAFGTTASNISRFEVSALNVVKFSLPRPTVQGMSADRDMHGASFAQLLHDCEV